MGNVISFIQREQKSDAAQILATMAKREVEGSAEGCMVFDSESGRFIVTGAYVERLQHAAYTLMKGLNDVMDRIANAPGAGYTTSSLIDHVIPAARRGIPLRMREDTNFGGL